MPVKLKVLSIIAILSFLEGLISLWKMITVFGTNCGGSCFSAVRLAIILGILIPSIGSGILAIYVFRRQADVSSSLRTITNHRWSKTILLVLYLAAILIGSALFLLRYYDPDHLLPVYQRSGPLLAYYLILAIQWFFIGLYFRRGLSSEGSPAFLSLLKYSLFVLLAFLFLWGLVAITGIGITPDPIFWRYPGVIIQFWQIGAAIVFTSFLWIIARTYPPTKKWRQWIELLFPVSIWLCAVLIWTSVPNSVLGANFFAPTAIPSNQPFPYSDAANYDMMAHSLLLGDGFMGTVPPRMLYIVFLAGLHSIAGDDYPTIIFLQTLVLALFPVILYFIGLKLHGRWAGLLIAFLEIGREWNSLIVSSNTAVSNSKLLLSDLPTALGVSICVLIAIHWLQSKDKSLLYSVLLGGTIGLVGLIRTQSLLILPFILAGAFLAFSRRVKEWLVNSAVVVAVMVLTVSPWAYRNLELTGRLIFDDPITQIKMVSDRYAFTQDQRVLRQPGEDLWTYADRLNQHIRDFAIENPPYVAGFISNQFMANEIYTVLELPFMTNSNVNLSSIDIYWTEWQNFLTFPNELLILLYLAIISVGLASAWRVASWASLLPLLTNISYSLSNAVARNSGWRFILPGDWAGFLYFGIGIMTVLGFLGSIFGEKSILNDQAVDLIEQREIGPILPSVLAIIPFLLVGLAGPLLEKVIPAHFENQPPVAQISSIKPELDPSTFSWADSFVQAPNAQVLAGRILYPRYFKEDTWLGDIMPAYGNLGFKRVGFFLMGRFTYNVVIAEDQRPQSFPYGVDALVFACQNGARMDAYLIVVPSERLVIQTNDPPAGCPSQN